MEAIGYILLNTNEYKEGKLSWNCSEFRNLGFPIFDCTRLLSDMGISADDES